MCVTSWLGVSKEEESPDSTMSAICAVFTALLVFFFSACSVCMSMHRDKTPVSNDLNILCSGQSTGRIEACSAVSVSQYLLLHLQVFSASDSSKAKRFHLKSLTQRKSKTCNTFFAVF